MLLPRTLVNKADTAVLSLRVLALANRVVEHRPHISTAKEGEKMASRTTTSGGDYDPSDPLNGFVDLVRRVVLQPTAFFAGLPRQGSLLGPLVFALICIEVYVVLVGLLTFLGTPGGITWLFGARGDQGFLAFLTALVMQLLVILVVGSRHSGFGATFRVVAYSSVTSLLGWLPFIGWIFSLYRLYLATVGIREMHATTTGRALLVVLLPAILILVLVLVVVGASAIVFFRAA